MELKLISAAGGQLRIAVPRAVVPILLEPLIASFCQAYPEIEVEIAASEKLVDLAAEGFAPLWGQASLAPGFR